MDQPLGNQTTYHFFTQTSCLSLLVIVLGCVFGLGAVIVPQDTKSIEGNLRAILNQQQQAWNRGDIPQFMSAYWQDEALTFSSGGTTTRGWQATLDRYRTRYPDKKEMGELSFTNLESSLLAENVALTLGSWHLQKEKPSQGNFSLVWKKIDGHWKIVHDHSSLLPENK